MKRIITIVLGIGILGLFYGAPPKEVAGEQVGSKEECKKIRAEIREKMKEINLMCKDERSKIRKSLKDKKSGHCWKEYKGDIDQLKSCLLERKQKILTGLSELHNIISKCFDERISLLESYKSKIKECKEGLGEFKRERRGFKGKDMEKFRKGKRFKETDEE